MLGTSSLWVQQYSGASRAGELRGSRRRRRAAAPRGRSSQPSPLLLLSTSDGGVDAGGCYATRGLAGLQVCRARASAPTMWRAGSAELWSPDDLPVG